MAASKLQANETDATRRDTTRRDTTRIDAQRHDATRRETTRHDTTRRDATRHDTTRHDAMFGAAAGWVYVWRFGCGVVLLRPALRKLVGGFDVHDAARRALCPTCTVLPDVHDAA